MLLLLLLLLGCWDRGTMAKRSDDDDDNDDGIRLHRKFAC